MLRIWRDKIIKPEWPSFQLPVALARLATSRVIWRGRSPKVKGNPPPDSQTSQFSFIDLPTRKAFFTYIWHDRINWSKFHFRLALVILSGLEKDLRHEVFCGRGKNFRLYWYHESMMSYDYIISFTKHCLNVYWSVVSYMKGIALTPYRVKGDNFRFLMLTI